MFHQIFWIQSPKKILSLGRKAWEGAQGRREMTQRAANISSVKSAFLLTHVSDLIIWPVSRFVLQPQSQWTKAVPPSMFSKAPINNKNSCFVILFQYYPNCLPFACFFTMINIHTVLIQHLFSVRDTESMVIQVLRARSEKAQDMDLNVVVLSLYSAFRIEIQAIFYSRTSIVYIRKGRKARQQSCWDSKIKIDVNRIKKDETHRFTY